MTAEVNVDAMRRALADINERQELSLATLGSLGGADPALLKHCLVGGGVLHMATALVVADILRRPFAELFNSIDVGATRPHAATMPVRRVQHGSTVPFVPEGARGPRLPGGRR